jgi:hypothetical protein
MANIGPRDTLSLVMMTGWDATELANYQLQDGTTYAEVVSRVNAALAALNAEFANDWMAELYSYQDNPEVSYRVGSSNGFETHTEYARPDAYRAATEGHMLPLIAYDRGLGWTWDYLRDARMSQIEADIADAIKDARDKRRVRILTRLLKRGDDSGSASGLGSTGYSPGFATAAASTNVDFTPPTFGGTTFDSNHEHYVGISGGVFTNAVFQDAYDELREHGHEPPFDFLLGPSDRNTVEALSNFTPVTDPLIVYGATQDRAGVAMQDYIGVINHFRVREVRGVPQYYGAGYKSYGRLSQRNPLRLRLHKGSIALQVTAMTDPNAGNATYPIQYLMLFMEFGVGVADRTAATPRYVNSATWSDGTPT